MSNNRVVHFEIPANEPKALTNFYRELFGWKFQLAPIPGVEIGVVKQVWTAQESTAPS